MFKAVKRSRKVFPFRSSLDPCELQFYSQREVAGGVEKRILRSPAAQVRSFPSAAWKSRLRLLPALPVAKLRGQLYGFSPPWTLCSVGSTLYTAHSALPRRDTARGSTRKTPDRSPLEEACSGAAREKWPGNERLVHPPPRHAGINEPRTCLCTLGNYIFGVRFFPRWLTTVPRGGENAIRTYSWWRRLCSASRGQFYISDSGGIL